MPDGFYRVLTEGKQAAIDALLERVPWVRKHALEMLNGNVGYVIGGLRITLKKRKIRATRVTTLNKSISCQFTKMELYNQTQKCELIFVSILRTINKRLLKT